MAYSNLIKNYTICTDAFDGFNESLWHNGKTLDHSLLEGSPSQKKYQKVGIVADNCVSLRIDIDNYRWTSINEALKCQIN